MSCIQGSYGQRDEAIITAAVSKYYIIFYHFFAISTNLRIQIKHKTPISCSKVPKRLLCSFLKGTLLTHAHTGT